MRRKLFVQSCAPFNVAASSFFVAVGTDASGAPEIETSSGGIAWAQQVSTNPTDAYWNDVADANSSLFIVVGGNNFGPSTPYISTSPNGSAWTSQSVPLDIYAEGALNSIYTKAGPLYLAMGFVTGASNFSAIWSSLNGTAWTLQFVDTSLDAAVTGAAYANGTYVASVSATNSSVYTSPNGTAWTLGIAFDPITSADNFNVATNGSIFVVVGRDNNTGGLPLISTSPDGFVWTQRSQPITDPGIIFAVNWISSLSLFIAVGSFVNGGVTYPLILTSLTGVAWTQKTVPGTDRSVSDVDISAGVLVAVGYDTLTFGPVIWTSTDANTWVPQTAASTTASLFSVVGR